MFLSVILELNANHHGAGLIWIVQKRGSSEKRQSHLKIKSSDWGKGKLFVLTLCCVVVVEERNFGSSSNRKKAWYGSKKVITKTK